MSKIDIYKERFKELIEEATKDGLNIGVYYNKIQGDDEPIQYGIAMMDGDENEFIPLYEKGKAN